MKKNYIYIFIITVVVTLSLIFGYKIFLKKQIAII